MVRQDSDLSAKEERVRVTPVVSMTNHAFEVDVYNEGEIDIHVKQVCIGVGDEEKTLTVPLLKLTPMPAGGQIEYICVGEIWCDIQTRREARFGLVNVPDEMVASFAAAPPESIWLSVKTYGGEIHRVSGERLEPALSLALAARKADAKARSPRLVALIRGNGMKTEIAQVRVELRRKGRAKLTWIRGRQEDTGLSDSDLDTLSSQILNGLGLGRIGDIEWRIE